MKIVILYHLDGEQSRSVDDYVREIYSRYPDTKVNSIDVDSSEGTKMAELYDIQRYPAVMVIQTEGNLSKLWQDEQLPLIDEVMAFIVA